MKKLRLLPSAVLSANMLLASVFLGCGHNIVDGKRDGKVIIEKMKLSPLYQGVNGGILAYWIDSTTMICYATAGVHGFTCIPCDSLKRLSNSH